MTDRSGPLVSIIAAVANDGPAALATLLRSVLGQTHRALELLVVDRASAQGTVDLLAALAGQDVRLRVIRLAADPGETAARNIALAAATGAFVGFAMAGEAWAPDKIARQLDRFASTRPWVGVVYGWSDDGAGSAADRTRWEGEVYARLLARPFIQAAGVPLFRRQLLLDVGGLDPALPACADLALYLALAERCDFACVPDVLVTRAPWRAAEPSAWFDAAEAIHRWARLSHPELPLWLFALGASRLQRRLAHAHRRRGDLVMAGGAWAAWLVWNAASAAGMLAGSLPGRDPAVPPCLPWRREAAIARQRIDRGAPGRLSDLYWSYEQMILLLDWS